MYNVSNVDYAQKYKRLCTCVSGDGYKEGA